MLTTRTIEIDAGRPLRYLANGNRGKPKLLLLHGVNSRAEYFDEFLPFVTADYDIFAPDFRGHGGSFRSDEPYSLGNYAADISRFIEQVVGEPFLLLGMSLGGRIGLILAARHRTALRKMVVVDVGPDVDPAGLQRIVEAQRALPARFTDREALRAFYRSAYCSVSPHYIERIIRTGWQQLDSGEMTTSYDRRIWDRSPEDFVQDAADLNALLPQIATPVLVIRGALSDILKADDARNFVNRLKDGRLVEIPNTTHGVLLEEPARCAELIQGFLAS